MANGRHTPGPWRSRRTGGGFAITQGLPSPEGWLQVAFVYGDEGAAEEDAALIAAAPDLIEAAERLIEHFADPLPEHMVEEFRAAIAKARGG